MPGVVIVRTRGNVPASGTSVFPGCATATGTAGDVVSAGRAFYMSPTGSDTTGTGTLASPWFTTDPFFARPPIPGDTLYARGGTYNFTTSGTIFESSGTAGAPITVRNYPGETPVFRGYGTAWDYALIGRNGASYIVIDGITFENYVPTQTGIITIGGYSSTVYCSDWTIRNCSFEIVPYTYTVAPWNMNGDHAIYAGSRTSDILVEDCRFFGPYPGVGMTGAGVHSYHSTLPCVTDLVVQRCIFDSWEEAVQLWSQNYSPALTATLTHNTFVNCETNIDIRYHGAITVRDNAGESGDSNDLYDPYDFASTTADHNFWGQEFDADYYLIPGSTAIDAASDGTDAGALDAQPSQIGMASATGTAYAVAFESATTYEAVCLEDSPSFLLPMDESSGTITDVVASLTGTATGTPTYGVTGPVTGHTAIQFDASGDYFTVGANAALDLGDGPFSIEWWMARDTDTGGWQFAFAKGTNAYGVGIDLQDYAGFVKAGVIELAIHQSVISADSQWHHYVLTRSASRGTGSTIFYKDGAAVTTTEVSTSTTLSDTTDGLNIGSELTTTSPLRGRLAYIGLYKSVLTPTRIAAHYSARTLG